ncbi:MAG: hypothetical protein A4S17_05485 [Proteobacteria bacterium HN_bin10]|nr:MAG: hypothetical protein A4S17_05485 [Proteobacteria bacterium HN_bin10]
MTSSSASNARARVKRVVALKLIIMRFADLAHQLSMRFEGSKSALESTLDRAIVADKLIRSVELVFLRPNGELFVHAILEINWQLHGAIVQRKDSDEIEVSVRKGEVITDVISPALSDVIWYLERRFRAEGINTLKWYVNWRTDSRDDPSVRDRALAASRELGFVPLSDDDHAILKQAALKREITGSPVELKEAGVTVREY